MINTKNKYSIKDNLEIMKSMNLNLDLIFIPEIHPDGLVLNYSTTYEFRNEQEDIMMSNTNFCVLPSRIRTYLKKEYGTVDINNTNYGRHFKKWPLEMSEVVNKLTKKELKKAHKQIKDATFMVLNFLIKENDMSINTYLHGNLDKQKGIEFEEYWVKVGGSNHG